MKLYNEIDRLDFLENVIYKSQDGVLMQFFLITDDTLKFGNKFSLDLTAEKRVFYAGDQQLRFKGALKHVLDYIISYSMGFYITFL